MPVAPPTFRPRGARQPRQVRQDYDRRRGSARERGYDNRWDKASVGFLRAHPLCLGCEARGRVTAATVTDHVIPHKGDMKLFWDSTRWQPACDPCHSIVKQKLEALFERGLASEADLWLNSEKAKEISGSIDPGG